MCLFGIYRCFDPITQKLYVSHHVLFLEHIPFFSILAKVPFDVIKIYPFEINGTPPSSVPTLEPLKDCIYCSPYYTCSIVS